MAKQRSAAFPYRWPDGSWHSRPYAGGQGVNKGQQRPPIKGQPYPGLGGGGTTAPPFDPELEARRAAAEARRKTMLGDLDVDLQQESQRLGFKYNPATGAFGGFDPSNPFSQAALLAKTRDESTRLSEMGHQRRTRGTQQSYALAGQLYSGSYLSGKAEDERVIGETRKNIKFDYERGYDTLRRGFEDYVKRYLRRKRDIQTVSPEELAAL